MFQMGGRLIAFALLVGIPPGYGKAFDKYGRSHSGLPRCTLFCIY